MDGIHTGLPSGFLRDDGDEAVEGDPSQDLPIDGQQRDALVVAAVSLTAPVLEQGDERGIPELFGQSSSSQMRVQTCRVSVTWLGWPAHAQAKCMFLPWSEQQ